LVLGSSEYVKKFWKWNIPKDDRTSPLCIHFVHLVQRLSGTIKSIKSHGHVPYILKSLLYLNKCCLFSLQLRNSFTLHMCGFIETSFATGVIFSA
jgi:hypothetical protein